MDALRGIPRLFFDLIARIVPGLVGIIALTFALSLTFAPNIDPNTIVSEIFKRASELQNAGAIVVLSLLLAAYILGQVLDPIGESMEIWIMQKLFKNGPKPLRGFGYMYKVLKHVVSNNSKHPSKVREFLLTDMHSKGWNEDAGKKTDLHYNTITFLWGDWLSMHKPKAGDIVSRFQAEHIMFRETAAVCFLAMLLHLCATPLIRGSIDFIQWWFVFAMGALTWLSLWEAARRFHIYQYSVIQQYYVARADPPPPEKNKDPED